MITRRPAFNESVIHHAVYIGERNPSAAERFLDAVERSVDAIHDGPYTGRAWASGKRRLTGVRMRPVMGFRSYLLFYRPVEQGVEMLQLLHGAQDIHAALIDED